MLNLKLAEDMLKVNVEHNIEDIEHFIKFFDKVCDYFGYTNRVLIYFEYVQTDKLHYNLPFLYAQLLRDAGYYVVRTGDYLSRSKVKVYIQENENANLTEKIVSFNGDYFIVSLIHYPFEYKNIYQWMESCFLYRFKFQQNN